MLAGRGVLGIGGEERVRFLQGLVSNDVTAVSPTSAIHAALLSPQGRYLHDFIIAAWGDTLWLDVEADRRDDLQRRLKLYKLRAKITVTDITDQFEVAAVFGPGAAAAFGLDGHEGAAAAIGGGVAMVDPRLAGLGVRLVLPRGTAASRFEAAALTPAGPQAYEALRLALGVPDGSRDLVIDKTILLEANFDCLHGLSWAKGCYVGQELTARTHYRGLIRKRLFPVRLDGTLPPSGTVVRSGERSVGELRSGCGDRALALLRLEELAQAAAAGEPLLADGIAVTVERPAWATF
ncbi:MAG: folate-binding protein [Azospirillum sp.]|nr:folate-binding protein [Azospirillum sp.]